MPNRYSDLALNDHTCSTEHRFLCERQLQATSSLIMQSGKQFQNYAFKVMHNISCHSARHSARHNMCHITRHTKYRYSFQSLHSSRNKSMCSFSFCALVAAAFLLSVSYSITSIRPFDDRRFSRHCLKCLRYSPSQACRCQQVQTTSHTFFRLQNVA